MAAQQARSGGGLGPAQFCLPEEKGVSVGQLAQDPGEKVRAGEAGPALSRALIVRESIAMLDTEGIEALSMRKLGARLNAGATSLYRHVALKDELMEPAVDEVVGEILHPPADDPNWRAAVTQFADSLSAWSPRKPHGSPPSPAPDRPRRSSSPASCTPPSSKTIPEAPDRRDPVRIRDQKFTSGHDGVLAGLFLQLTR